MLSISLKPVSKVHHHMVSEYMILIRLRVKHIGKLLAPVSTRLRGVSPELPLPLVELLAPRMRRTDV